MYADLPKSVIKIERFVLRLRRRYGEVPAPSVLDKIERARVKSEKWHARIAAKAGGNVTRVKLSPPEVIALVMAVAKPMMAEMDPKTVRPFDPDEFFSDLF
jgi:hypothetical protein